MTEKIDIQIVLLFLFQKYLQNQMKLSIGEQNEKYYTELPSRLANPLTGPNTCWSILKRFL